MSNPIDIRNIKTGLETLGNMIADIADRPVELPEILDRSLSGNKINGGKITNFSSTGIKDTATAVVLQVTDNGIITNSIDVDTLQGNTSVTGDLNVAGHITASSLHVDEITADVRIERSSPLEFVAGETNGIYGKGLLWRGQDRTRQFLYQANPDRILSSESIDIAADASYMINGQTVLTDDQLGTTITKSNLRELGALRNLTVQGDVRVDEFIYYEAGTMRVGFNTEEPNGMLSLMSLDSELVFDPEGPMATIGTYTTSDLQIITDNTPRIVISNTGFIKVGTDVESKVTIPGKLGVGVANPPTDASITTSGPIRLQGTKHEVGNGIPTSGNYSKGDIVWNTDPKPTGYVGWVCVREGTPGLWKSFGQIAN